MTAANPFNVTGPDLVLATDMDPLAVETTSEIENLAQDCYHWLICIPGGNLDNIDRGVGIYQYLSGTSDELRSLPSAIEADFQKDARVVDCVASIQGQPNGAPLISVQVQPTAGGILPLLFGYSSAAGLELQSWR